MSKKRLLAIIVWSATLAATGAIADVPHTSFEPADRIDEMDAALASLEVKASQAKADSKDKADEIIADLKKRRDEFQALLKTQAESGVAAWARAKTELVARTGRNGRRRDPASAKRPPLETAAALHLSAQGSLDLRLEIQRPVQAS